MNPEIEWCRVMEIWCLEKARFKEHDTIYDVPRREAFREMAAWLQSKRANLGDAP